MICGCWLNFICDNNIKEYYLKNCIDKEIGEKKKIQCLSNDQNVVSISVGQLLKTRTNP